MKKLMKTLTTLTLAFAVLYTPVSIEASGPPNKQAAQAFDNKIVKRIDQEVIYNHVHKLAVGIGERVAGSEAEHAAADYIAEQYLSYGLDVEIQEFPISVYEDAESSLIVSQLPDAEWGPSAFRNSPSTPNEGVTADVKYAGLGGADDFAAGDFNGKIALVERGEHTFVAKVQNAANAGAIAVIMYNNQSGGFSATLSGSPLVPTIGITREEGQQLKTLAENGTVEATVTVTGGGNVTKMSQNVVATKPAHKNHDTGGIIYIGSHHDSVPGSPGASDNATGVAVNLEIARVMSNMMTDTEIRFITFGSEEIGLVGSRHYVSTLTEDEVARSVGMYNFDMVGSEEAGEMIMFTVDGNRNIVTDTGHSASLRVYDELTYGRVGRSDHQPFHDAGIAAAVFTYAPLEPHYHRPTDTIDHISKERMENMAKVVSAAVYQLARKDTPAQDRAKVKPQPGAPDFENRPL